MTQEDWPEDWSPIEELEIEPLSDEALEEVSGGKQEGSASSPTTSSGCCSCSSCSSCTSVGHDPGNDG